MTVAALIGIGVMTDSSISIKIATNHKNKSISFINADLGSNISPKIIEDNIFAAGWDSSDPKWDTGESAYKYCNSPPIYVYESSFATLTNTSNNAIIATDTDIYTTVDIDKTDKMATGSSIQMAAGYEGVGKSAGSGGYYAYFGCFNTGTVPNISTTTEVDNYYRYVPK
jgi:hypothetical protein